tara:strand:+ start:24760 stop:25842 length:1083 start_codon:yes stop_codon:yes gene_type:complete
MKVLHLSYSKTSEDGGINIAIKQLINNNYHISNEWICNNTNPKILRDFELLGKIKKSDFDLIHIHGLWRSQNRLAAFNPKSLKPFIITPHGMIDKWALSQSKFKKKIAINFWEKKAFNNAKCIHALCQNEANEIRSLFPDIKIAVIPNSVSFPDLNKIKNLKPIWSKSFNESERILLFLGRFHKKKGIEQLLSAWKIFVSLNKSTKWRLVFIGYGDKEYLLKRIQEEKINYVKLFGTISGVNKDIVFNNSSAFILPSFSEGLPMAAIEAMTFKLPCLLSRQCNLSELYKTNDLLNAEPNIQSILNSLINLNKFNQNELNKIGKINYDYVSKNFSSRIVSSKINELYNWILGNSREPTFLF